MRAEQGRAQVALGAKRRSRLPRSAREAIAHIQGGDRYSERLVAAGARGRARVAGSDVLGQEPPRPVARGAPASATASRESQKRALGGERKDSVSKVDSRRASG